MAGNTCKVAISLPCDLLQFADRLARFHGESRSKIIADALAEVRRQTEGELAAEGYQLYAHEASEFAQATQRTTSETNVDEYEPESQAG